MFFLLSLLLHLLRSGSLCHIPHTFSLGSVLLRCVAGATVFTVFASMVVCTLVFLLSFALFLAFSSVDLIALNSLFLLNCVILWFVSSVPLHLFSHTITCALVTELVYTSDVSPSMISTIITSPFKLLMNCSVKHLSFCIYIQLPLFLYPLFCIFITMSIGFAILQWQ